MEANYIKEPMSGNTKAWKRGGIRFVLGMILKDIGLKKFKKDVVLVISQYEAELL